MDIINSVDLIAPCLGATRWETTYEIAPGWDVEVLLIGADRWRVRERPPRGEWVVHGTLIAGRSRAERIGQLVATTRRAGLTTTGA